MSARLVSPQPKADAASSSPTPDSNPGPAKSAERPRLKLKSIAAVLAVTAASGLLFGISAATSRSSVQPQDATLIALVRKAQSDVADLDAQVSDLRKELDSYDATPAQSGTQATVPGLSQRPVTGPGARVTLTDAPSGIIPDGATPNDLVIHQQDIEDIMNALWEGGAEAMSVQGVRVTGRTVVRCIGNVILVDGASFSPPYVIEAIGDPETLRDAVENNPRVVNYKSYVALYGLGWTFETFDSTTLPAANTKTTNTYAQAMDEGNG